MYFEPILFLIGVTIEHIELNNRECLETVKKNVFTGYPKKKLALGNTLFMTSGDIF